MKLTKKFLSIALVLALFITSVFSTGIITNAASALDYGNDFVIKQITVDSSKNFYDYSSYNFADLGENIIKDSTVKNFDKDGNYGTYKSVSDTPELIWDRPIIPSETTGTLASPKARKLLVADTATSHTNDGSGSISNASLSNKKVLLPLWAMQASSYYVITFFVKPNADYTVGAGDDMCISYRNTKTSDATHGQYDTLTFSKSGQSIPSGTEFKKGDWYRLSYVVYTGANWNTDNYPFIAFCGSVFSATFDDIYMYKLSSNDLGAAIVSADQLIDPLYLTLPDTPEFKQVTYNTNDTTFYNYDNYDFAAVGTNTVGDPTVNEFDGGVYKTYDETSAPNATWSRVVLNYQSGKNNIYSDPKQRDMILTDGSHTDDGSGTLYTNRTSGERQFTVWFQGATKVKTYYLLTAWIKSENNFTPMSESDICLGYNKIAAGEYGARIPETKIANVTFKAGEWRRVSWLVYTGNIASRRYYIQYYSLTNNIYVDDIYAYEMDARYGTACMNAGYLLPQDSVYDTDTIDNFNTKTKADETTTTSVTLSGLDTSKKYYISFNTMRASETVTADFAVKAGDNTLVSYTGILGNDTEIDPLDTWVNRSYAFVPTAETVTLEFITNGALTIDIVGLAAILPGDANNDTNIDILDLVNVDSCIANTSYSPFQDLNGDSKVDTDDLEILRKMLLGISED